MKKTTLNFVEHVITVLGLVLYSGAILTLFTSGGYNEGELTDNLTTENALIKQIFLVFYVITILLLACRWQKTLYVISKNLYILLFTGLAISSIAWSTAQDLTTTRVIAVSGTNLFGLYLASRYTLKQQVLLLVQAFGIIVLLSMLFVVILPRYGIMGGSHAGAWRGVFNHKNVLGKLMILSTAIFFLQSINCPRKNILIYLGLMFSIILLVMSKSSSSLVNLALITIVFFILKTWRWSYIIMIPASFSITLLGSGFFLWFNDNSSILFSSVGKDSNLSGRTDLWSLAVDVGLKKPWLGYGYGAFWDERNGAAVEIWRSVNWRAPNAHNGFLDFFLSLGLIGIVLLGLSFINTFTQAFIYLRHSKTSDEFWPLIFMFYFILANFTESALMLQNDLFTVTYVAISYSMTIHNNAKARSLVYGEPIQA
jgi:exopolysaccharide production protein ExoQ